MERHLTFLVECRGAFGSLNELKVRNNFAFCNIDLHLIYFNLTSPLMLSYVLEV